MEDRPVRVRVSRRSLLSSATTVLGLASGAALLAACGASAPAAAPTTTTAPAPSTVSVTSAVASASSTAATTASQAAAATSTSSVAAATSAAATSSAGAKPGQKITLEHLDWWQPNTPVLKTYFDGIKREFEAKHPEVTISYTFLGALTGQSSVEEKWITNTAGGTPHDTSQVSVAFIYDLMGQRLMEPLDPYLATTSDMALSNFVDTGLFYNTYQGKHYGIPYDGPATNVIAYNTDHFTEVGLDPSRSFTWKWTYSQFLDAAQKLVKTQGGKVVRGGFQPTGYSSIDSFLPWLYADGGQFFDQNYQHVLLDDQHGQGALQFTLDLKNQYHLAAEAKDAALENEGYSMVMSGSWTAGYILDKNPKLHWAYAPVPQGPLGPHPASQTWTNQWVMNGQSRQKETAWAWLSFVNAEDTLERYFAGVMKRAAGRKAFYQSAAWKGVLAQYPQLTGLETVADLSGQYPWVKFADFSAKSKPIWSGLVAGTTGASTALTQLQQIGDQVLASG